MSDLALIRRLLALAQDVPPDYPVTLLAGELLALLAAIGRTQDWQADRNDPSVMTNDPELLVPPAATRMTKYGRGRQVTNH